MDPKAAERLAIMQNVFRKMSEIENEYVTLLIKMGCKRVTLHRF